MRGSRIFALVLLALLLAAQGVWASETENLIVNGGIEEVDEDGLPSGWIKGMWYYDGSSELAAVSSAYEGGYSLYVDNLSENDARFEQTVQVQPDTLYRISCMVRAEGCSTNAAGAGLSIKDTFVSSETVYDTRGEWTPVTLYGVTGSDQTQLVLMARVGNYGSLNVGRAWFDNFEMVALEEAPEGAFVQPLSTLPPVEPEGEDQEDQPLVVVPETFVTLCVGICYVLVLVGFLVAALRSKLPAQGNAAACRRTFWMLCALAMAVRVALAVSVRGYEADMNCFEGWAARMAQVGPGGFYSDQVFCDYPPGYMYVLWLCGTLIQGLGLPLDGQISWLIIKLIPMAADIACAYLVYRWSKEALGDWVAALMGALFAFNPAAIINSAAWGQVDGVLTALLLCCMLAAAHGHYLAALPLYAAAVLVKPQALMLAPLGLAMLVLEVVESQEKGKTLLRLLGGLGLGIGLWLALSLPFIWSLPPALLEDYQALPQWLRPLCWLLGQYGGVMNTYRYITVNACNLYELMGLNWIQMSQVPSVTLFAMAMLAAAYAFGLFLYIKAKDRGKVFLCGAVILALVYAFAPMMHERYMYPALAFLLLAYVFDRDLRLLGAFTLLSFSQFMNVALVLQSEYLATSQQTLNHLISLINVLTSVFLAWTGWEMCVSGHMITITRVYRSQGVKAKEKERAQSGVAEGLLKGRDARLNLKRRDITLMVLLTALYAAVAFPNLGSMSAPQTQWKATASGEQITFDLGQVEDFTMTYYGSICSSTFLVQLSEDGQVWSEAHYAQYDQGKIFQWLRYQPSEKEDDGSFYAVEQGYVQRARYVRIIAERAGLTLCEVGFLDQNGQVLPIASVYSVGGSAGYDYDPKALIDEQETVPPYPSYLNGMYFDEIYHGRTAYEFLNQWESVYEYTHPPLGKVLIMVGIQLFGMTPFGWRFMPALFGVLMVPLMYLLGKQLFRRSSLAFIGAFLLASDCMHFTQSRLATIDVFAVFFIMLMYLFMIRYAMMSFYHVKLHRTLVPLGLCGISMGLAVSCKWIGLYGALGLAFIFFFTLAQRYREYRYAKRNLRTLDQDARRVAQRAVRQFPRNALITIGFCVIAFLVVPALIYYMTYYWHLGPSGRFNLAGVWQVQKDMFNYHSNLGWDNHYFKSRWYEWPLIVKPMWYYSGSGYLGAGMVSSISCMGNPVVWWGGALAMVWVMARLATAARGDRRYLYVVVGFLAQYVPWMFVTRSTFIYHYFASVPFIILATVALFEWVRKQRGARAYRIGGIAYCAAASVMFIAFYPLMSGLPVLRSYAQYLRWFHWENF